MWLVCILSLALCLHSNTHVTEISSFQNAPYAETHPHEVNQPHIHSHQDTYHEHFVGYDVSQNISFWAGSTLWEMSNWMRKKHKS